MHRDQIDALAPLVYNRSSLDTPARSWAGKVA